MKNIFNLNRILFLKSFFCVTVGCQSLKLPVVFQQNNPDNTIGSLLRMFMTIYVRRRKDVEQRLRYDGFEEGLMCSIIFEQIHEQILSDAFLQFPTLLCQLNNLKKYDSASKLLNTASIESADDEKRI